MGSRPDFSGPRALTGRAHIGLWAAALLLPALVGCEPGSPEGQASGNDFTKLPMPVAVERARSGSIASFYTTTSTLEVEKEAEILARVSGIVESLVVEEGDFVEEGSTLLRVDNEEYRFRLQQAEANTKNLQSILDRMELSRDLVSAEVRETARNDLAMAMAVEELARLDVSYTNVAATFTGRVVHRMVDVGQTVSVGTPLFALADFNPLLARIHIPSREFKKIKTDQAVEIILDSNKQRLQGRIMLVSPTIDPRTGTIKVTVEIPEYPEGTRPGDFAEVKIVTERKEDRTLVRRYAIFTDKGEQVVYVAIGDVAERRVVEVGFMDEEHAEILNETIQAGDRVIVKGHRSLQHGAAVKVLVDDGAESAPPPSVLGS